MEIKILQVFYGKDGLPYKDKDRQVHFPIAGTGFLGASKTTKIKFYYDELDNLDETTWVAVSKLPNGKVGSRVLESYLDEELNEHYALLELDNYYTQYKGDVFISLQGYQGGVDFDYDEENSQYEIHGTPTIGATGSIKFTINYANQFVGSGETDNINFQRILAALGTKLGMRAYSEHVEELPSEGSPDVFYVVNDDPNNPNLANIYVWNENTRHYIWVGDNTLDLGEYYTKEQGESFEQDINEDIDILDTKVTNIQSELQNVAQGSPKGVYATLSDLETAYPTGTTGIYLVSATGHWYYWNGSAWTDGGVYQATGVADGDAYKSFGTVGASDDLNDFTTIGSYYIANGSQTHKPSDMGTGNGMLLVFKSRNTVGQYDVLFQAIITQDGCFKYFRRKEGAYWDANWQTIFGDGSVVFSKLSSDIQTMLKYFDYYSYELVDGQYVNSGTGETPSYSGYKRTPKLNVSGLANIDVYVGIVGSNIGCAFYDENETYISGTDFTGHSVGDTLTLDVPDKAKYFCVCCSTSNISGFFVRVSFSQKNFEKIALKLNELQKLNYTVVDNEFVFSTSGDTSSYSGYQRTSKIDVSGMQYIDIGIGVTASNVGCAFYDKNDNYISGTDFTAYSLGDVLTLAVPSNAKYFMVCWTKNNYKYFFVRLSSIQKNIVSLGTKVNELQTIADLEYTLTDGGYIIYSNGTLGSASNYSYTDYINVYSGLKVILPFYFGDYAGIAFYDKAKSYISGVSRGAHSQGDIVEVSVPNNAVYMRLCCLKNFKGSFFLKYQINNLIYNLSKSGAESEINPCLYDGIKAKMFDSILCIGDSLTEGIFNYNGTSDSVAINKYSYPYQLKKLTGATYVVNKGSGGLSSKVWWSAHQNDDFSGFDACIIELGLNDFAGAEYVRCTSEERIAALTNIYNALRTACPKIPIFISSLFNTYNGTNVDEVNNDLETFASEHDGCYYMDLHTYGQLGGSGTPDTNLHLTALGYFKLATYYFNYMSYIIDANPQDFKEQQFVGTNYEI